MLHMFKGRVLRNIPPPKGDSNLGNEEAVSLFAPGLTRTKPSPWLAFGTVGTSFS